MLPRFDSTPSRPTIKLACLALLLELPLLGSLHNGFDFAWLQDRQGHTPGLDHYANIRLAHAAALTAASLLADLVKVLAGLGKLSYARKLNVIADALVNHGPLPVL
jgi:hypothetical protein